MRTFICVECEEHLPLRNLSEESRRLVSGENGHTSAALVTKHADELTCFWCEPEADELEDAGPPSRSAFDLWLMDGITDNPGDAVVRALNW